MAAKRLGKFMTSDSATLPELAVDLQKEVWADSPMTQAEVLEKHREVEAHPNVQALSPEEYAHHYIDVATKSLYASMLDMVEKTRDSTIKDGNPPPHGVVAIQVTLTEYAEKVIALLLEDVPEKVCKIIDIDAYAIPASQCPELSMIFLRIIFLPNKEES